MDPLITVGILTVSVLLVVTVTIAVDTILDNLARARRHETKYKEAQTNLGKAQADLQKAKAQFDHNFDKLEAASWTG